jgi:hypothetical protein
MSDVKIIVNKTFSGFLSSLKQEILNGYASCAKSELRNGFFSAQLVKATDSKYVSAVSKMDEAETNAFRITFFVEGISSSVKAEDLRMVPTKEDAIKALEEMVEISQTTGQYEDVPQADAVETVIEKKPAQKRQRRSKTQ